MPSPPVFFIPKHSFWGATVLKGANKKIKVRLGERGCIRPVQSSLPPLSDLTLL